MPLLSRLRLDATDEVWLYTDRGVDPVPRPMVVPYGVHANEPMDSASDKDRYEAMERTIAAALDGAGCGCGCGCVRGGGIGAGCCDDGAGRG